MLKQQLRRLVLAGSVAALGLSAPGESMAITNWFGCGGLFSRPGCFSANRVSFFGAVDACNSCCTTCCPTQVCSYVPQTQYQACTVNVPVTTYRPVTTCDPCTGCTTTCMRPFTSYVQQTRYRPVTTYRLSCSTTTTCTTGCGVAAYSVTADTGCCTGTVTVPATSTPAPSLQVTPPATQDSSNQNIPSTTPEQEASYQMRPVPERNISVTPPVGNRQKSAPAPRLSEPQDRVASTQPLSAWAYSPVTWQSQDAAKATDSSAAKEAAPVQPKSDGGWRSSSR